MCKQFWQPERRSGSNSKSEQRFCLRVQLCTRMEKISMCWLVAWIVWYTVYPEAVTFPSVLIKLYSTLYYYKLFAQLRWNSNGTFRMESFKIQMKCSQRHLLFSQMHFEFGLYRWCLLLTFDHTAQSSQRMCAHILHERIICSTADAWPNAINEFSTFSLEKTNYAQNCHYVKHLHNNDHQIWLSLHIQFTEVVCRKPVCTAGKRAVAHTQHTSAALNK